MDDRVLIRPVSLHMEHMQELIKDTADISSEHLPRLSPSSDSEQERYAF